MRPTSSMRSPPTSVIARRTKRLIADLLAVDEAVKHAQRHVARWMRPQRIATDAKYRPGYNRLLSQPLGVVGVVAPWNYPYQLSMLPALGGARGRQSRDDQAVRARARDSRSHGPHRAGILRGGRARGVPGDAAIGKAFVELPFDHLFFTGSTAVGRAVAQAAAQKPDPGDARAWRQVAGDRRRRRQIRFDSAEDRDRQALQRRSDVHCAGLRARAAQPHRTNSPKR